MKVVCDECQNEFTVAKIKGKKVGKYKGNNVRFNYFDCPACKHKYFVSVRERELNKMTAKYKKYVQKIKIMQDHDDKQKLLDELKALEMEIKAHNDMLKNMFKLK